MVCFFDVAYQRFGPPTNEEHFEAATRVVAWVRWIDRGRNSRMLLQYRLFLSAGRSEAAKAAHKYLKPLIRLCERTRTTPSRYMSRSSRILSARPTSRRAYQSGPQCTKSAVPSPPISAVPLPRSRYSGHDAATAALTPTR